MEKDYLKSLVDSGMSTFQISKLTKKSQTSIVYWLKKFNLKTQNKSFKEKGKVDYGEFRFCPRCKENKCIEDFYKRRKKEGSSSYCKLCTGRQVLERQRRVKVLAVEYKGGKCVKCGYNKYIGALDFHHLNPKEKDFSIASIKQYAFSEKIRNELDKCILLCSNCHREEHAVL